VRQTPQASVPATPSYRLLPNEVSVTDRYRKLMKFQIPFALFVLLIGFILIALHRKFIGGVCITTMIFLAAGTAGMWNKQRTQEEKRELLKEDVSIDRAFMLAQMARSQESGGSDRNR
jgi:hypothetical protein